jgi:hypothetical protein
MKQVSLARKIYGVTTRRSTAIQFHCWPTALPICPIVFGQFYSNLNDLLGKRVELREVNREALVHVFAEQSYERRAGAVLDLQNF